MLRDCLGNTPSESKTRWIWLLNSKYLLSPAEGLHNVLLLAQTWACCERDGLDFVPGSLYCCPSWQSWAVTVRRRGWHSLPQSFCWISAVRILPKFLLSEQKRTAFWCSFWTHAEDCNPAGQFQRVDAIRFFQTAGTACARGQFFWVLLVLQPFYAQDSWCKAWGLFKALVF